MFFIDVFLNIIVLLQGLKSKMLRRFKDTAVVYFDQQMGAAFGQFTSCFVNFCIILMQKKEKRNEQRGTALLPNADSLLKMVF